MNTPHVSCALCYITLCSLTFPNNLIYKTCFPKYFIEDGFCVMCCMIIQMHINASILCK